MYRDLRRDNALLIIAIATFCLYGEYVIACPRDCICEQVKRYVSCSRRHFWKIPEGIPLDTLHLSLNDNAFANPNLTRANFTTTVNVENLILSGCGIEHIESDTFTELRRLQWLDISQNRIKVIEQYTFRGLALQHLFINDNHGISVGPLSFVGLRTHGLYMQKCAMLSWSLEAIKPLNGTLQLLWLDGNNFESFHHDWYYVFRGLSHLRLGDNPFHCNCKMVWLKQLYSANPDEFSGAAPPSCQTPSRLRGQFLNELNEDDFKCQLPIFKNVDVLFDENEGHFRCDASGDPNPTLYWIRPDGTTETYVPPDDELLRDNVGLMTVFEPQRLQNAAYVCIASNPAGNVTFTLNVAWPKEQQVLPPTPKVTDSTEIIARSSPMGHRRKEYNGNTNVSALNRSGSRKTDAYITMVELVGAIIGTFLVTLLLCIIIFHFYRKRQGINYLHSETNGRKASPKRTPSNLYYTTENGGTLAPLHGGPDDDNTV